jgi:hypothetical protein
MLLLSFMSTMIGSWWVQTMEIGWLQSCSTNRWKLCHPDGAWVQILHRRINFHVLQMKTIWRSSKCLLEICKLETNNWVNIIFYTASSLYFHETRWTDVNNNTAHRASCQLERFSTMLVVIKWTPQSSKGGAVTMIQVAPQTPCNNHQLMVTQASESTHPFSH